ncbi:hypothetical protein FA13DRAFT_1730899 [Coprinellus micaceus]|jgi:hypothetical protein|uniref:Uncharacterized protein n=1 Tax=Coprinellus micaceus TaxID=71717 RepID=A0A4Y7TG42_COPMI|nr:hypothetical protein FA13DRAFT_1730899 [Coprinellus micaceus]
MVIGLGLSIEGESSKSGVYAAFSRCSRAGIARTPSASGIQGTLGCVYLCSSPEMSDDPSIRGFRDSGNQ